MRLPFIPKQQQHIASGFAWNAAASAGCQTRAAAALACWPARIPRAVGRPPGRCPASSAPAPTLAAHPNHPPSNAQTRHHAHEGQTRKHMKTGTSNEQVHAPLPGLLTWLGCLACTILPLLPLYVDSAAGSGSGSAAGVKVAAAGATTLCSAGTDSRTLLLRSGGAPQHGCCAVPAALLCRAGIGTAGAVGGSTSIGSTTKW